MQTQIKGYEFTFFHANFTTTIIYGQNLHNYLILARSSDVIEHHRLNGSSSPVLTATCLFYGRLCDFLGFFPKPTWRSHPSTDFDAKWLKRRGFTQGRAFWSKNCNSSKPLTPRPKNRRNLPNFGRHKIFA